MAKAVFTGAEFLAKDFFSDTFTEIVAKNKELITTLPGFNDFTDIISAVNTDFDLNNAIENGEYISKIDEIRKTPTDRTVYMDSNIALTDGRKLAKDGAKVIPNLFDTIEGLRLGEEILAKKVESIDLTHGPSTADSFLFVSAFNSESDPYGAFSRSGSMGGIEISASSMEAGKLGNAERAADWGSRNMHFRANEITFTVSNPNQTVLDAYKITNVADVTEDKFEMNIVSGVSNLLPSETDREFYWIPLEDSKVVGGKISAGSCGKIMTRITGANGDRIIVYASHATAKSDVTCEPVGESGLTVSGEVTYNLGAIIEAIQELNRRTMFMDTDMSFQGALSYADYVTGTTAVNYGHVVDGLPAGSNDTFAVHNKPMAA